MKNRAMFKNKRKGFYEINNKKTVTEIYLYDEIGWYGVEAETFIKDLKAIKNDVILRINSPGGRVFDGMAIYNAVKDFKHGITTIIDGLAASAASYIALAGDTVKMAEGAFLMIHNPMSLVFGSAEDMRKEAELLDKVRDQIAGIYQRQSGKSKKAIVELMKNETWFTGEEALENNFIDETIEETQADNLFDLSVFNNTPETLVKESGGETPQPKNFERALRDAGLTRQEAKAVLSEGLKALKEDKPLEEDELAVVLKFKHKLGRKE